MNRNNKKVLAIVPARSNSKSIINKNLRLIEGHPLIAFSISAALQNNNIDRVICSTDSKKIAMIAKKYGADVPFLRPKNISNDYSTDLECFTHCLNWLYKYENYIPDILVHLRPTCPVRFKADIDKAILMINKNKKIDSVRSLSSIPYTPYKMWKVSRNKYIEPIIKLKQKKETFNLPRQKLPKTYYHNGVIDVIRYKTIIKNKSMSGKNIAPLFLHAKYCYDIDTPDDLKNTRKAMPQIKCIKPKNIIS